LLIIKANHLTTFPAVPSLPNSDDNDNDDREDDDHEDNPQEACIMSKATIKMSAAAAAAAAKKTATAKTTDKTKANYCLMAPGHSILKSYGLRTKNKFAVSFDTKGSTDFVLMQFYVNSVLPEKGGYLATLLEDGYTIRWSRPVDLFLFTMEHICSIMGSKYYLESNVQVHLFDKIMQAILKDKIKHNANRNYWGKPQEIHLKKRCMSTPKTVVMPYKAPYPLESVNDARGQQHYQFHMIVLFKVDLVDQQKTLKKNTKTKLIDLYEVESSQGSTPSPGACCSSKKRDWGGIHCKASHGSWVSKDVEESNHLEEY
jgi:hypothetical protein